MWDYIPIDILSHIFSFLPPQAIAQCISTSKHWQTAAHTTTTTHSATWLLAMLTRGHSDTCFTYNPSSNRWHSLPLTFLPSIRPIAPVGSLLLCKLVNSTNLRLLVVNVFTKQFRFLPELVNGLRSNAAVGIVVNDSVGCGMNNFRIFVAGGASGASYEQSVEVYDSNVEEWRKYGIMPLEYAVRLTVWTPNENVHCKDGTVYWMTSARAYSVVGFNMMTKTWREVKVPRADKLEWATIVSRRSGKLGLVGGEGDREGCVWELQEGDEWKSVGYVPKMESRNYVKCVDGGDGLLWLFRQIVGKVLVGDGNVWSLNGGAECAWLPHMALKVVAIKPCLSRFSIDFGK